MGSKRNWLIVLVVFYSLLWLHVQASENYTQDSLNSFLYDYAFKKMPRPLTGFLAYDSSKISIRNGLIELNTTEDNPIVIQFPNIPLEVDKNVGVKCVRFGTNGTLEFSNMIARSSCASRGQGHFSVVVPYQPETEKKKRVFRWWVVGIPAGVVGLVLLLVLGVVAYKFFKWKSIREMERQSEKSEGLGTIWVGSSKMPSASGIRTQPVLETSYVP
ncbi:UNVERIFIED_CONTAM: hypothetical protein Scaly_0245200 [Sesamum calycinum]|uniref:Uncharacterized protein n=1 Tax=Sesamum calycinum TaxID=2727403 RepID=A0AAW2T1F8_9LAMI